jgi:hypothetical protein
LPLRSGNPCIGIWEIAIRLPEKQTIEVKGQLTCSNLGDIRRKTNSSERFLSFIEVLGEDRQSFNDAFSFLLQ